MTDDELRAYVVESRARQGLPPTVTDPATIQRIADLIRPVTDRATDRAEDVR